MEKEQIKKMVDKDIHVCTILYEYCKNSSLYESDENIQSLDLDDFLNSIIGLNARYSSLIKGFPEDIDLLSFGQDEDDTDLSEFAIYLKKVSDKLNTFKLMGYSEENSMSNITITNTNTNTNTNFLSNINYSFQDARNEISNNSSLNDSEYNEILEKIDALENIVNSSDLKRTKWNKAKEIIKWVLDKGFDVAKVILPLVLKIQ